MLVVPAVSLSTECTVEAKPISVLSSLATIDPFSFSGGARREDSVAGVGAAIPDSKSMSTEVAASSTVLVAEVVALSASMLGVEVAAASMTLSVVGLAVVVEVPVSVTLLVVGLTSFLDFVLLVLSAALVSASFFLIAGIAVSAKSRIVENVVGVFVATLSVGIVDVVAGVVVVAGVGLASATVSGLEVVLVSFSVSLVAVFVASSVVVASSVSAIAIVVAFLIVISDSTSLLILIFLWSDSNNDGGDGGSLSFCSDSSSLSSSLILSTSSLLLPLMIVLDEITNASIRCGSSSLNDTRRLLLAIEVEGEGTFPPSLLRLKIDFKGDRGCCCCSCWRLLEDEELTSLGVVTDDELSVISSVATVDGDDRLLFPVGVGRDIVNSSSIVCLFSKSSPS